MIRSYLKLCRINIAAFAAFATTTGYFLGPWQSAAGAATPAAAVFLLVCGASALNQCQEWDLDAKMDRTRTRPIPSNEISVLRGVITAMALLVPGFLLLYSSGASPLLLGLFSLLWYNGVYTRLKKFTAFASIPGAASGMIPPAIGWASTNGSLIDARLAVICFIFFLWQVPHFWLLHLRHPEDYARAGLPSLTRHMHFHQLARLIFVWLAAASVACLLLPLYGPARSLPVYCSLVTLSLWLLWQARSLVASGREQRTTSLFGSVNAYLLIVMSILTMESIFLHKP